MKRLVVTVLAVLLGAFGVASATAAPAGAAVRTSPAARPAAARPAAGSLTLMPLGDSITWGVGSSTGNGYRSALYDALAAEGYSLDFVGSGRNGTMADPDNEGHSGWLIEQIAGIADSVLATYHPNVV